jgi:ATP-dependent helicase/nuclease subunit B
MESVEKAYKRGMDEAFGVPMEVVSALDRGATVLTGNLRAAQTLRMDLDRRNRELGLASWAPPAVLSWDAWLAGLWHRLLLDGATSQMLLNRIQEDALWRAIIAEDSALPARIATESLARLAADAWSLLARYRGFGRLPGSATNGDTEAFTRWAAEFDRRCRANGYLSRARLVGFLRQSARNGALRSPQTGVPQDGGLLLLGFDRIFPAQKALLEALGETGARVEIASLSAPVQPGLLTAAEDEASEIRVAALWIRSYQEENPAARVAVLVPGLGSDDAPLRARIDRTFRQILAPGQQPITASADPLPYEFSTGSPLSETPLVTIALDLLRWTQHGLPIDRIGHLLLSPDFAGDGESSARAEFDAYDLRPAPILRPEISLDGLIERIKLSRRQNRLPQLLASLRAMRAVIGRRFAPGERRPWAEWAEGIRELLQAAAWATSGPAPHDSLTDQTDRLGLQVRAKWESALDELSTLDFEGARVPPSEAIATLHTIVQQTAFAPDPENAPIQIMTPEEAAGSRFDAVWFLHAGDLAFPPPVAGNPLLSWPLRRDLGMPGSDAAADLAYARSVTARIAASAATTVFSYARETADGHQRPSAALATLGLEQATLPSDSEPVLPVTLENLEDLAAIPALPERSISGGANVLREQAACAFRAFSQRRLFATALETNDPGMNARERGNIVHEVLERFWNVVGSQSALRAMTGEARDAQLLRAIDQTLARTQSAVTAEPATAWDAAYLDTQRSRLLSLGRRWLDLELTRRVPFTVVRREAETRNVSIGPLHLSLRVDRVDQTEQGAVLIDYKTGDANATSWLGDRPDEPQLPLYAVLAQEEHLHAIAFGKFRAGTGMELTGYEDQPGTLTRPAALKVESLEAQLEAWHDVLVRLATDFAEGRNDVSPKQYPGTCTFCAQRLICRLDVAALQQDDEDETPEEPLG